MFISVDSPKGSGSDKLSCQIPGIKSGIVCNNDRLRCFSVIYSDQSSVLDDSCSSDDGSSQFSDPIAHRSELDNDLQ